MAKTYRVNLAVRISNAIVDRLLRLGVNMGPTVLLTVPGRKTGILRSQPVAILEHGDGRWLLGTFGDVNWVRNLRAAGRATLTRRGKSEEIVVTELSPDAAAPIIRDALKMAAHSPAKFVVVPYFDVTAESSLEDIAREAPRHPLFEIHSTDAARVSRNAA
jgi:deazaflavin-dependent oxidoreductase (nitroreductase family)